MMIEKLEIFLESQSKEEESALPVWDSYIKSIIIDERIPSFILEELMYRIDSLVLAEPKKFKFSSNLASDLEGLIFEVHESIKEKYGLTFSVLNVLRKGSSLVISSSDNFDIWVPYGLS